MQFSLEPKQLLEKANFKDFKSYKSYKLSFKYFKLGSY